MGALVNRRPTTFLAAVVAVVICGLNVTLIALTVAG
jgi:Mn2+/Fe2+ NRAMP family transporter